MLKKNEKNEKKLSLKKVTVSSILEDEMIKEVNRMIGKLPSAATCKSIDQATCLCRTHKKSCTCPPPLPDNKIFINYLFDRND